MGNTSGCTVTAADAAALHSTGSSQKQSYSRTLTARARTRPQKRLESAISALPLLCGQAPVRRKTVCFSPVRRFSISTRTPMAGRGSAVGFSAVI